jgi:hypothetical protein
MSQALKDLSDYLVEIKGNLIDRVELAYDELTLMLRTSSRCCAFCVMTRVAGLSAFIDICGVDYPARAKRFDVVYHLLSPYQKHPYPGEGDDRRRHPGAQRGRYIPGRQLVRTRGGSTFILASCFPATRLAPYPHRLWFCRSSAAQGLPRHRPRLKCATTTRRRSGLRTGQAGAGIPHV